MAPITFRQSTVREITVPLCLAIIATEHDGRRGSATLVSRTMRTLLIVVLVGASLPVACPAVAAADKPDEAITEMAARVDARLASGWTDGKIQPADRCDDAEFLRRTCLDLTGVIPTVADVREFLADTQPEKRGQLVDRLLASPRHATHLATLWRKTILPDSTDVQQAQNAVGLESWLRGQFVDRVRYDRVVAELLMSSGDETGPALFYTAQELKPEKLAASTARIFLGLQLQCAECHDHPFDRWTQRDFWSYAAFFAQLAPPGQMVGQRAAQVIDVQRGEVTLPGTQTVVAPRFPGVGEPPEDDFGSRRTQLAVWMASRDNPYLAQAAVNRVWSQLFGRGLVEPVDDLGPHNSPSHPQLLEELTEFFVANGFDLTSLYRVLTATAAYQQTSRPVDDVQVPPDSFAIMATRPLSAEQLYDSLRRSLSDPQPIAVQNGNGVNVERDAQRQIFLTKMRSVGPSATEYNQGVLQALTLINGTLVGQATDLQTSGLLGALQAPFFDDEERLNTLFLATLSRRPREEERVTFAQYVAAAASDAARQQAWSDVLWALLNCAEFAINH